MQNPPPGASEVRYRRLFETAQGGILILDGRTGVIVDANPFLTGSLGYRREELLGKRLWQIDAIVDADAVKQAFAELEHQDHVRHEHLHLRRKDGSLLDAECISDAYEVEGQRVYQCNILDLTDRRRLVRRTRDDEARFRALIENAADAVVVARLDGTISYVSPAIEALAGYQPTELIGRRYFELLHPDDVPVAADLVTQLANHPGTALRSELRYRNRDGAYRTIAGTSRYLPDTPGIHGIVANIHDVTANRQAEAALRSSQQLVEGILNAIPVRVFWKDRNLHYLGCNAPFARDAGFVEARELVGKDDYQMVWREQAEGYRQDDRGVIDSGRAKILIEEPQTTADGHTATVLTSKLPLRDAAGGIVGVLGAYMDITEHKQREQALLRSTRALKALSSGNRVLMHARTEDRLYAEMTHAVVEQGGYRMAWVGLVDPGADSPIRPVGKAGDDSDYVSVVRLSWDASERGSGPAGRCVRSGQLAVSHDIAADPSMAPWQAAALDAGFRATVALPLRDADAVFGVLCIYSTDATAFDADELALLSQMADELAFGVRNLRTRVAHDEDLLRLERSMEATVQALAGTVEIRDPYTAGHQRRVADIALGIGRLLGLSTDRLRGLQLAAVIHDIGKLSVPAEILSKPGKLSAVEYELIKGHAEAGYQIIKDIEFPWPVAEIVRQHHERLDGGGYPRGLKGAQILPEAMILAVADVVEAMSSHRPYRSSRGVAAALEEISRGRGSAFDPDTVDACLRLFGDGGFKMPE
ncbi:MAG: PAS domain S-box protein [Stagnimonas sp.]|nr:PAS domain S-box protein [Stagnimonas sp.]